MNARQCLLLALLSLPSAGLADDPGRTTPASVRAIAPASDAAQPDRKRIDLTDPRVREIVRATAASHSRALPAPAAQAEVASEEHGWQVALRASEARATRPAQYGQCEGDGCTAYSANGEPLVRYQRNLTGLVFTGDREFDHWLSCQQDDDMLTTFERYERCGRGPEALRRVDRAEVKLPRQSP